MDTTDANAWVVKHLPIAKGVTRKYARYNPGVDVDSIFSDACYGLVVASRKQVPVNKKPSTHAYNYAADHARRYVGQARTGFRQGLRLRKPGVSHVEYGRETDGRVALKPSDPWIMDAVAKLPKFERSVITLLFWHDMPLCEVSGALGITRHMAAYYRRQGFKKLKARLRKCRSVA